jgi:hypothetical protein
MLWQRRLWIVQFFSDIAVTGFHNLLLGIRLAHCLRTVALWRAVRNELEASEVW